MKDMGYKILLTGFEPFEGRETNVSEEVLKIIAQQEFRDTIIHKAILPVSFEKAPEILRNLAEKICPELIMMLGETSQAGVVKLERVALNLMDSDREDNYCCRPVDEPINEMAPAALFSSFPIKEIKNLLLKEGFKLKVSTSAGVYVCNRVYFEGLKIAGEQGIDALFVHLPVDAAHYTLEKLKLLILTILNHYRHG